MGVSISSVGVIMQPGQDDRTAGRTGRSCAKGIVEEHPLGGQRIQVRSFYRCGAVTSESLPAMIISDDENDVGAVYGRVGHRASDQLRKFDRLRTERNQVGESDPLPGFNAAVRADAQHGRGESLFPTGISMPGISRRIQGKDLILN